MEGYPAHHDGSVCVLELQGDLDAAAVPALNRQLHQLAADGVRQMVLDFSRVPFADLSAVHLLAEMAQFQAQQQGSLALSRCNAAVKKLFRLTGLDALLDSECAA